MGVGVSGWRLARAVSAAGGLGVVAGTALDLVLTRRLQLGDPGGHVRRGLAQLPLAGVAQRILDRYFIPGGKSASTPFRAKPLPAVEPSRSATELVVAANFVEVYLAREGHERPVGVNYLTKIQLPTLPSLYGAMLAGVGYVLMGAGIPGAIPGILDRLARSEAVELTVEVNGAQGGPPLQVCFDPRELGEGAPPVLTRPRFLAIVSSAALASRLTRSASGRVDGFVFEHPSAGGHNAPPRGAASYDVSGQPVYGPRDELDLEAVRSLGRPFWLAGSRGRPGELRAARALGATGIQVGTAFALCEESDLDPDLKRRLLEQSRAGTVRTHTDALASPTGFPFKVAQLAGTLSDGDVLATRRPQCDLGYLRQAYARADGSVVWRCPAEPRESFLRNGGHEEEQVGRQCLCNALTANIGLGQVREDGERELPLVTIGDDVVHAADFLAPGAESYTAARVVELLEG
jgi:nitronate monooxygenase